MPPLTGLHPASPLSPERSQWGGALNDWSDVETTGAAVYVTPAQPDDWRRTDPSVAAVLVPEPGKASPWVLDTARRLAVEGNGRALQAYLRAAKPPDRGPGEEETLPPEVAAAMLKAALVALGEPTADASLNNLPPLPSPALFA